MKFLDESGLEYLWGKIQNYSDAAASNAVDGLFVGNTSKINATYLPSYVDDVIEFDGYEDHTGETGFNPQANSVPSGTQFKIVYDKGNKQFYGKVEGDPAVYYYFWPETEDKAKYTEDFNNNGKGDKGKIYVDASTNKQYRWAGQDAGLVELSTASAVYYPANSNLTTVSKLGDIAANTSAQTLSGKTISQILDDILFVTDVPGVTAASKGAITLTGHTNGEVILEGTPMAAISGLNFSVNQAKTTKSYVADGNGGYTSDNNKITLTENDGSLSKTVKKDDVTTTVSGDFSEGIYKYEATQDIKAIANLKYLDNKGGEHTYSPSTTSFTGTFTINVTKPVYSNGALGSEADKSNNTNTIAALDSNTTAHTVNIISDNSSVIIRFPSEHINGTLVARETFEFPNTKEIVKVQAWNPMVDGGTWEDQSSSSYTTAGTPVHTNFVNWQTNLGTNYLGPRTVKFILKNETTN